MRLHLRVPSKNALVAQWLEHSLDKRGVASSTLARRTKLFVRGALAPKTESQTIRSESPDSQLGERHVCILEAP